MEIDYLSLFDDKLSRQEILSQIEERKLNEAKFIEFKKKYPLNSQMKECISPEELMDVNVLAEFVSEDGKDFYLLVEVGVLLEKRVFNLVMLSNLSTIKLTDSHIFHCNLNMKILEKAKKIKDYHKHFCDFIRLTK